MDDFGLQTAIELDGRKFIIHTGTLMDRQRVISEIFEEGLFLTARELYLPLRRENTPVNYDFITGLTNQFHEQVIDELKILYHIQQKLEKVYPAKKKQQDAKPFVNLGILFLRRNLYEEAERAFLRALTIQKGNVKANVGLGITYLKMRQFTNAVSVLQKTVSEHQRFPDVLNYLGLAHLFAGNLERATTLFKEAIQINPDYVEAQFNLGVALYKSALQGVKDPRAVAVPARVSIYLKQVRDLEKYRDPEWEKEFSEVLELMKDNDHEVILPLLERLQLKLVEMFVKNEKVAEFFLKFQYGGKAFDVKTISRYDMFFMNSGPREHQYPDYWNNRGVFQLIKSHAYFQEAIRSLKNALAMEPNYHEARETLEKLKAHEKGFIFMIRAMLK